MEVVAALGGLLVLSPLLLVSALAVAWTSPGPVVFRQERVGRGGRRFTLYKLRSMRTGTDGPGVTSRDDRRVTSVGRWLRRAKLDEIPQLWNVVRGDMSLVGPRPEVPLYADPSDPTWQRVLSVRPGITDPVTLRLRDEDRLIPDAEADVETFYRETLLPYKLRGYIDYIERRTWWTDLCVLVATVGAVVRPLPPLTREDLLARDRR